MKPEYAEQILKKTREDYNRMADEFSRTRPDIWRDLFYLKKFIKEGDKVLDLGCGNGRLVKLFEDKKVDYMGADNSERLIEIAKKRYQNNKSPGLNCQFIVADALNLPFGDNTFDKIYSIAVFHHIPSKEFRLKFLKEAKRVLKKDGLLIMTVWNLWQKKTSWPIFIKLTFLKLIGLSKLDFGDLWIPWGKTIKRYIRAFTKRELRKIAEKAGFSVKEFGLLKRKEGYFNIYLVARK